jgi:serine/threonine protein kinase
MNTPCSYLHINGFIHRDVKAANLLIDDDGTVLLGDLGVAASLADDGDVSSKATGSGNRVMNFDPLPTTKSSSQALPHTRPSMGKRGSFVGTVRGDLILTEFSLNAFPNQSLVGWHLSLFGVIVTTPRLTFGHLQLLLLSLLKAGLPAQEKAPMLSSYKRVFPVLA